MLDTCVLLWLAHSPDELSRCAKEAIDDPTNELWLSHATVWEISLKHLSGKLSLPAAPRKWFSDQITAWGINYQPIDLEVIHLACELPAIHKDPFDRLIVAQARANLFTLVSPDQFFPKYQVPVIW